MDSISAIILAAGEGTRMKSSLPKVLHKVCGKEMIGHVVDAVRETGVTQTIVVIGYKGEMVKEVLGKEVETAYQEKQLGTGHAVKVALPALSESCDTVIVLYGDTPLVRPSTIKALIAYHNKGGYGATVLTVKVSNPQGYGRIIRDAGGHITGIVEERDATPEQKGIEEINSGIYCFDRRCLVEGIQSLRNDNAQGEYYLTDIVEFFKNRGIIIGGFTGQDPEEIKGVNDKYQLAEAQRALNHRNLVKLMDEGVIIEDPGTTYIDKDVAIAADTRIMPGTYIEGNTTIGSDNVIGPGTRITNCSIGNGNEIQFSVLRDSDVGNGCRIGPYAHIRPNSRIDNDVRIGNFVEVKNSHMGNGSKASHLSYVGDGDVGMGVNIGCGVVFVNYDGRQKHRTTIEDGAFIGCNVNLVAPVTVRRGAYVAAGSTITKDITEYSLGIERGKQAEIKDWVIRKGFRKD
ncbi:MAG: N-acetylglucosamine-1-phosphate uridyltransferase / Glucosamine-1-phosphate N-acetyltransferase [Firmicutes bacterium]|nr:N-acetylglucosamine-1-phosphate uridyltransferase / Glucosamine-1-phosphate N-acetyltransferase [Bacillota bacterium]MDI6705067.1 bifunctional UDP-N-acetylglucosamine diphosphorylase/glucosamine-1-phosphate N-acetyltransferase GlmU [Bacillota bacterium]